MQERTRDLLDVMMGAIKDGHRSAIVVSGMVLLGSVRVLDAQNLVATNDVTFSGSVGRN